MKLVINFVCEGSYILVLGRNWTTLEMDRSLDGCDSISSHLELNTCESEAIVSIRPIFLNFYCFLELFFRLVRFISLLKIARKIENRWRMLRIEFQCLLIAVKR